METQNTNTNQQQVQPGYHRPQDWRGSLRWRLAMEAMRAALGNSQIDPMRLHDADQKELAHICFGMADAMIERNRQYRRNYS